MPGDTSAPFNLDSNKAERCNVSPNSEPLHDAQPIEVHSVFGPERIPVDGGKIRVVHEELIRQREAISTKQANLQVRGGILIGGAGVGLAFLAATYQSSRHLNWEAIVAGVLAIAASAVAVVALEFVNRRTHDIDIPDQWEQAHGPDFVADDIEETIVSAGIGYLYGRDIIDPATGMTSHDNGERVGFRHQRYTVTVGYCLLVMAWIFALISLI